jgi:hypothetical protein
MKFRPVPKEHVELVSAVTKLFPDLEERRMFGCPVWFLKGHMVVGAHQATIFLRLSDTDQKVLMQNTKAVHFSPVPGRTMREYVSLPSSVYRSTEDFARWLRKSVSYVSSLPPRPEGQTVSLTRAAEAEELAPVEHVRDSCDAASAGAGDPSQPERGAADPEGRWAERSP